MNRSEYMKALEEKLQFVEEEARNTLLEYYGEMLDDRMEDGMDEPSAVAAMEAPDEIAARLQADPSVPKQAESEAPVPPPQDMGDEALKFSSLVNSVLSAAQEGLEEASHPTLHTGKADGEAIPENGWNEVAQKLRDTADAMEQHSMGGVARKLREAADSAQTSASPSGGYEQMTLSCPADQLQGVRLDCWDMPIQISPAAGREAELIYYTCESDPYEAFIQDGIMTLRRKQADRSKGRFSLSILGGLIKLNWSGNAPTVELKLPQDALVDLTARTTNGSIRAEGLSALCDVALKTSNGRIMLNDLSCKALEAQSSNARIVLERVSGKQPIRCSTSNGRIEARQVKTGGSLILTSSNGRIVAHDAQAREELRLTTSNSAIEVGQLSAGEVNLTTSNGSISGILPGHMNDWAIRSRTSNGHNSLPKDQPGSRPLNVRTSNGSINLRFEEG